MRGVTIFSFPASITNASIQSSNIVNHCLPGNSATITMPFSSLFSFGPQISDRIESFWEAERRLLEYARTRFAHRREQDAADHHFELFDTPVRIPSVIDEGASTCQVHNAQNDGAAEKNYSLHGMRVLNKRLLSDDDASTTNKQQAPLMLLHRYANGSLYFYRNLMGLSRRFGTIYALGMLGWGMSSRPRFDLVTGDAIGKDVGDDDGGATSIETRRKVSSAKSFFVESLESWRRRGSSSTA